MQVNPITGKRNQAGFNETPNKKLQWAYSLLHKWHLNLVDYMKIKKAQNGWGWNEIGEQFERCQIRISVHFHLLADDQ
jgi:hypothetical protein